MKNARNALLPVVLILSSLLTIRAYAASAPTIVSAVANFQTNQLTITGSNFGTDVPRVTLDGSKLQVVSNSPTTVVATLPTGTNPGGYLLTLTDATNGLNTMDSDLHRLLNDRKQLVLDLTAMQSQTCTGLMEPS